MEEKSFKSFYIIIRAQNYIDVFSMIKNINIYMCIYIDIVESLLISAIRKLGFPTLYLR